MKKFSEELDQRFNKIDILSKAVIGFEFEFFSNFTYYKTLEELNALLSPIKVHGFRKYHSDFKVDANNFKIEPDWSGGPSCVELITGPLDYSNARVILVKILNWMKNNATTDERCSIHLNISFSDKEWNYTKLKILKLILNLDEEFIYSMFPDRRGNVYCKTVKKIIPYKDYDFSNVSPSIVETGIHLPDTRYHGVNFMHLNENRLEIRYVGGEDYHLKMVEIMKLLDYFILIIHDAIIEDYDEDDLMLLRQILDKNINKYKSLSKLEDFMAQYPTVILQVDRSDTWHLVTAYYHALFKDLFDLVDNLNTLKDCIINWDTSRNIMEVVNAEIEGNYTLEHYDFINCQIRSTSLLQCDIINSEISQSHVMTCKTKDSEIVKSKVIETSIDEHTVLKDCFFMGGKIDGEMDGGVLRSGVVGKNAIISSNVEILTNQNFFSAKGVFATKSNKDLKQVNKKVV